MGNWLVGASFVVGFGVGLLFFYHELTTWVMASTNNRPIGQRRRSALRLNMTQGGCTGVIFASFLACAIYIPQVNASQADVPQVKLSQADAPQDEEVPQADAPQADAPQVPQNPQVYVPPVYVPPVYVPPGSEADVPREGVPQADVPRER
jgi:hypothetical protein